MAWVDNSFISDWQLEPRVFVLAKCVSNFMGYFPVLKLALAIDAAGSPILAFIGNSRSIM